MDGPMPLYLPNGKGPLRIKLQGIYMNYRARLPAGPLVRGGQGCGFGGDGAAGGIQLGSADECSLSKHAVPRLQVICGRVL